MKVKLVAITKPLEEGINTAQEFISFCARVSAPNNQHNTKTASGLLKYCVNHKHFSIFEMGNMVFEIETTRDISRQILRHRSFSFQEFSQRYATVSPEIIYRETRLQDTKNKQNSTKCNDIDLVERFKGSQDYIFNKAIEQYEAALSEGIAKEQARALLPEGLTGTRMYMNGTVRSWIHYCQVRCGVETQLEHRLIAKEICKELISQFPFLEDVVGICLIDDYSAEH